MNAGSRQRRRYPAGCVGCCCLDLLESWQQLEPWPIFKISHTSKGCWRHFASCFAVCCAAVSCKVEVCQQLGGCSRSLVQFNISYNSYLVLLAPLPALQSKGCVVSQIHTPPDALHPSMVQAAAYGACVLLLCGPKKRFFASRC